MGDVYAHLIPEPLAAAIGAHIPVGTASGNMIIDIGGGRSEAAVLDRFRAGNLLGTPDEVIEQVRAFERAGVAHMGVVMVGDSMDELFADMELFAERVLLAFGPAR